MDYSYIDKNVALASEAAERRAKAEQRRDALLAKWGKTCVSEALADAEKYRLERHVYEEELRQAQEEKRMLDVKLSLFSEKEIAEASDGKCVLISTHNGPLMALLSLITGTALENMSSLANNSITELEYENGSFRVIRLGYSEHLKDLVTKFKSNTEN